MSSLFVIQGRDQGNRFELEPSSGPVTLGRDSSCTIQLHDTEVSRLHAEIRREGGSTLLVDQNSSNGTFVNNNRVTQHSLVSGDQVQLGRTTMLFTGHGDSSLQNVDQRIRIVGETQPTDSRIVSTMRQEEGSQIFSLDFDQTQSNWLARARSNLQVMYRTALAVSHTLDIDQLLGRIMQLIFEWVEADRGCIMLVDPETRDLRPRVRRDRKSENQPNSSGTKTAREKINISQTILDYVMEHKEGVLTSDAREDQRWDAAQSIVRQGIREAICVPMQGRYDIVGVIYIDTMTTAAKAAQFGGRRFSDEHLKLMVAIGHQAALAVEDTNYYSAMVQAERLAAVGQTIATLSHHIKNILQGIRGGSYLIEMGLNDHDESITRKGWDIVEKNQNRISALVMDMLTFSKEREPELSPGELNETVADVVELMQTRAAEKSVQLTWQPAEKIPTLVFDSEGIHRATLNVLTNAIDACADNPDEGRAPGQVSVSTALDSDRGLVIVTVADNGSGISEEDQADIFSLFVSRKGSRGTGLGLPVSQKILKEHGGDIRIESEPNQGSRFILEFPLVLPESFTAHDGMDDLDDDSNGGTMRETLVR
ncbi:MAG: ATP-binding protein [Planctomycetota bacterium]|nr:ATP-binding protein [Planctomycetota bacterium]